MEYIILGITDYYEAAGGGMGLFGWVILILGYLYATKGNKEKDK